MIIVIVSVAFNGNHCTNTEHETIGRFVENMVERRMFVFQCELGLFECLRSYSISRCDGTFSIGITHTHTIFMYGNRQNVNGNGLNYKPVLHRVFFLGLHCVCVCVCTSVWVYT